MNPIPNFLSFSVDFVSSPKDDAVSVRKAKRLAFLDFVLASEFDFSASRKMAKRGYKLRILLIFLC